MILKGTSKAIEKHAYAAESKEKLGSLFGEQKQWRKEKHYASLVHMHTTSEQIELHFFS